MRVVVGLLPLCVFGFLWYWVLSNFVGGFIGSLPFCEIEM